MNHVGIRPCLNFEKTKRVKTVIEGEDDPKRRDLALRGLVDENRKVGV